MTKKFSKLIILTIGFALMLGGCKMQKFKKYSFDERTPEEFVERVKNEMEEKYDESFEVIDYLIPVYDISAQGKNNVILFKSSEGLYVTCKSPVIHSYDLYNNYQDKKMEVKYQELVDFQGFDHFNIISYYKTEDFTLNVNDVDYVYIDFDVFETPSEDILLKAYQIRNDFINAGIKMERLSFACRGNSDIKEQYPESYFIHDEWIYEHNAIKWYEILEVDILNSKDLSYEEFKEQME